MICTYRRYNLYKNIDHLLFKEAPHDWDLKKIKFIGVVKMGQSPKSNDYNKLGIGYPFLQGNAEFGKANPLATYFCETANKISFEGDILFSVRAPVGALNIADKQYGIGRGLCAITPTKICSSFLWYALKVYRLELQSISTGSTYEAVSVNEVANIKLLIPSENEQTQIASFLDKKTTQIDKLINEKEKLLKLLDEKRTAIITQAVTKGLDPNVEMKDSCIDWLGDIPKHWYSVSLKWISKRFSGGTPDKSKAEYWLDGDIPWFNSGIVNDFYISEPSNFITEEGFLKSSAKYFPPNSLLMALAGQGKTKGMVGLSKIRATCNQSLAVIIMNKNEPRFYLWWLHSKYQQIRGLSSQDGRDGLNLEMLGSIPCPLPPFDEQVQIALWLENKVQDILDTEKTIKQSINKLKEYREALIRAAVTGQIDVRKEASHE